MVQSKGFLGPVSDLLLLLNPEEGEKNSTKIAKNDGKFIAFIACAEATFTIKKILVQE